MAFSNIRFFRRSSLTDELSCGQLLMFGFGFFILISVSAYVANLAGRFPPDYAVMVSFLFLSSCLVNQPFWFRPGRTITWEPWSRLSPLVWSSARTLPSRSCS